MEGFSPQSIDKTTHELDLEAFDRKSSTQKFATAFSIMGREMTRQYNHSLKGFGKKVELW